MHSVLTIRSVYRLNVDCMSFWKTNRNREREGREVGKRKGPKEGGFGKRKKRWWIVQPASQSTQPSIHPSIHLQSQTGTHTRTYKTNQWHNTLVRSTTDKVNWQTIALNFEIPLYFRNCWMQIVRQQLLVACECVRAVRYVRCFCCQYWHVRSLSKWNFSFCFVFQWQNRTFSPRRILHFYIYEFYIQ